MDLRWWRSQIGLVQQEPFLFNDTIQKNIEYGLVGTIWEDAPQEKKTTLVKKACREAFADEFISRLPEVNWFKPSSSKPRHTPNITSNIRNVPSRAFKLKWETAASN